MDKTRAQFFSLKKSALSEETIQAHTKRNKEEAMKCLKKAQSFLLIACFETDGKVLSAMHDVADVTATLDAMESTAKQLKLGLAGHFKAVAEDLKNSLDGKSENS